MEQAKQGFQKNKAKLKMPRLEPLFKVQNCREEVDDPNEEDPVVLLFVSYLVIWQVLQIPQSNFISGICVL